MESKEFFEGEVKTPSVITLIVNICTADLGKNFRAAPGGGFTVYPGGGKAFPVTEAEFESDVRSWLSNLEGNDQISSRILAMVRENPGWVTLVAKRVIKEMRRRSG